MYRVASKRELSERDICTQFILPALVSAGWDVEKQIREEVTFTDGRIYVKGQKSARGIRKRADYILYYKANIPIAIIEAKDNSHPVGAGLQQALNYAAILDIPVALSSNGDGFVEHDRSGYSTVVERTLSLHDSPRLQSCGLSTNTIRGSVHLKKNRLPALIIFLTAVGAPHATINKSPSTAPLKRLPKGRSAFCS